MIEYLDVLNENGIATGAVATRDEIHRQGLWHGAILCAIINENNQILCQQRANDKEKYPGMWDLTVAGHISHGRDPVATVFAEFRQEVGVEMAKTIQVRDFRYLSAFRSQLVVNDEFIENQFYHLFVLNKTVPINEFVFNDNEVQAVAYKSYNDLIKLSLEGKLHPRKEWLDIVNIYIEGSL